MAIGEAVLERDVAEFQSLLQRLGDMSTRTYYNPYLEFEWPDSLPADQYWMSPELLSIAGTEYEERLSLPELHALSRWESMNFYSLNVHGIRELIIAVTERIHTAGFEVASDFFHHFLGEENEHMWFFARFCLNYGKIYPTRRFVTDIHEDPRAENFLVFARILIFEEIVDQYNQKMASDERLHPTVRKINRLHHQDESRHIAFSRRIVRLLYRELKSTADEASLLAAENYLRRYMSGIIQSLYNPSMYRDAGLPRERLSARALVADPSRRAYHAHALGRSISFFSSEGIFRNADDPA